MNFFESQERSRKNTRKLVLAMSLAVVAVVTTVTTLIVGVIWALSQNSATQHSISSFIDRNSSLAITVAITTAVFIGIASLYRIAGLQQGGSRVALDMGGTRVAPGDNDPLRRRLRNVVEEMAIASGVPVPAIFVLEQESGINAFAAGYRPEDAAIAVTRGALENLSRDELQGVIAHEFSHALNGDMRLNIKLMGPMFGILAIGMLGRIMLRGNRRRSLSSKGSSAGVILGLGFIAIGAVGVLLARLIKAGVSRQREYLADASAVQFTRQTEGIAGALKKIAGLDEQAQLSNQTAEEVSHMLFANGLPRISGWLATHPPLLERIQALDPAFSAEQFSSLETDRSQGLAHADDELLATLAEPAGAAPPALVADTESVLRTVGNPDDRHFDKALELRTRIPKKLRAALESQYQIMLLLPALMLHPDPAQREQQIPLLQQQLGSERAARVVELYGSVHRLGVELRLPLLEIILPALKNRPAGQLEFINDLLEALAQQNNYLELFEYTLLRIFQRYIEVANNPAQPVKWLSLDHREVREAAVMVLRIYAELGHADATAAARALENGLLRLGLSSGNKPLPKNWAAEADAALATLRRCVPRDREAIIRALIAAALHDNHVSVAESELLRAFCAVLDCPLPPLLAAH